jgi:hypothetical protein
MQDSSPEPDVKKNVHPVEGNETQPEPDVRKGMQNVTEPVPEVSGDQPTLHNGEKPVPQPVANPAMRKVYR